MSRAAGILASKPKDSQTFSKIDYEDFTRLSPNSDDFTETEVDGHRVTVVTVNNNCVGVYYSSKQFGVSCPEFKGDIVSFTEKDPNYPWN